ncbi:CAP domain-containing protein [bacterium]|nr:CAP domain-containing protein [bacterium]
MRISIITLCILFSFFTLAPYLHSLQTEKTITQRPSPQAIERNLLSLINEERRTRNLPPLRISIELRNLARNHSQEMAHQSHPTHLSSSGQSYTQRLVKENLFFSHNGENVAVSGTFRADLIHQDFMRSSQHRKNLLSSDYTQAGIGVVYKEGRYYITEDFLSPLRPRDEERVQQTLKEKINRRRRARSLPPLNFLGEADDFALTYSREKAQGQPSPSTPSSFSKNTVVFVASPTLKDLSSLFQEKFLQPSYEAAGLGVQFDRSEEHPGGAYFLTLILFPQSEYQNMTDPQRKDILFQTLNHLRREKGLPPFQKSFQLNHQARSMLKNSFSSGLENSVSSLPQAQVYAYETEDLKKVPSEMKDRIGGEWSDYNQLGLALQQTESHPLQKEIYRILIILKRVQ